VSLIEHVSGDEDGGEEDMWGEHHQMLAERGSQTSPKVGGSSPETAGLRGDGIGRDDDDDEYISISFDEEEEEIRRPRGGSRLRSPSRSRPSRSGSSGASISVGVSEDDQESEHETGERAVRAESRRSGDSSYGENGSIEVEAKTDERGHSAQATRRVLATRSSDEDISIEFDESES
jgi:hypothetical protein